MRQALLALLSLGTLAGCIPTGLNFHDLKLIDQRTFEGPAQAPTAADIARSRLPPLPVLVIRFDRPDQDYTQALADAVNAAQAHNPDVVFNVLTPMPTNGSSAEQARFIRQGTLDAQAVATAIEADDVSPGSIHIGLRGDPGSPVREVRVYAR